jgi:alpha-glucosidase
MQSSAAHTGIKQDELILHIYCGDNSSDFLLYMDDGETFDYQKGKSAKRLIKMSGSENKITITKSEGDFQSSYKKIKLVLHGSDANLLSINGKNLGLDHHIHSFFAPLERYDPINEPASMGEENVKIAAIEYTNEALEIKW